jgi:hypothetical protein
MGWLIYAACVMLVLILISVWFSGYIDGQPTSGKVITAIKLESKVMFITLGVLVPPVGVVLLLVWGVKSFGRRCARTWR